MPKIIREPESDRERRKYARYPWDEWLAYLRRHREMILVRGKDFNTTITALISHWRAKGRAEGIKVRLRPARDDSTLTVTLKEDG